MLKNPKKKATAIGAPASGPALVDQHGRPVSSYGTYGRGVYRTPNNVRTSDKPRPRPCLSAEMRKNLTSYDRRQLIDFSRILKATNTLIKGAISQKNMWAFGDWSFKYIGENAAWGQEATEYLKNTTMPFCNPRGKNYDFNQTLLNTGEALDTDGGDLALWTTKGSSSFPQIKIVEASLIATGSDGFQLSLGGTATTVQGGSFDGARIYDGIIYDRDNAMIGVRIWGENDSGEYVYSDIPAMFCDLLFEPEWSSQLQGIPRMATALLPLLRTEDIADYMTTAIEVASAMAITRFTESGEPGGAERTQVDEPTPGSEPTGLNSLQQTTYEQIHAGIYEMKTNGEKLEALKFERPSMNEKGFIQDLNAGAFWSLDIPIEIFDPAAMGRAGARVTKEMFRMGIWRRQRAGTRRSLAWLRYTLAKSMKSGYLSRNDDRGGADAYMWKVNLPAEFTVDEGNDRAADINDLKMGLTTREKIAAKYGEDITELERINFEETRRRATKAAALAAEFPWKTHAEWLDWLEQHGPNPLVAAKSAAQPQPGAPASGPTAKNNQPSTK